MNCNASQVLAAGENFCCLSIPQLKAAQLQLAANALLHVSPTTDVSFDAVLTRARTSGILNLTRQQLRIFNLQALRTIKENL